MTINQEPHYGNGKICYLELPSRNVDESSVFYQAVFDWKIRIRGDRSVAFDDGVGEVSGTWRTDRNPTTDVGMLVHIMVDDIEVTMKKIIERGGTIVRPLGLDAPEITAWFQDLSGNVLGLYQERQV
jgi:predicted enzyme related to lactoylglutathione lyase